MVYGSARASDMARAVKIILDLDLRPDASRSEDEPAGYIELGVLGNKGAPKDAHRRLLLPVVAHLVSLSGCKWWESWQEARNALDLETSGFLELPIMCRFDIDGKPLMQSMAAPEIGEFLRQTLGVATSSKNLMRSHSCKSTILSWLSKFGVPLPVRRL